ncbi:type VII secretion target [Actinoplanes sp. NPDC024001]|uniref:type VII secretion target n=1 Tax=Actinoplanes sp. NPDC024001 TaxID=3154598 RepID=UPI0033CFC06A
MTQPHLDLAPDGLRAHARLVDEAATMCDEAVSGAEYLDLRGEVYGQFCGRFVVGLLNPLEDWALQELRQGRDATQHLADLVRAIADTVAVTDEAAARQIRGD